MKTCRIILRLRVWILIALSLSVASIACAQGSGGIEPSGSADSVQTTQGFSQQELDQMLAPIALYPDPLLSQILMAATYPLEVVEAARWTRTHPEQSGDDAVRSIQQRDWDPSVKSLVAFPRILQTLDEQLEWTERLGEAFLTDQPRVMETIQHLRQKAYAAGNLHSNDQVRVESDGQIIVVEPASPDIVYVPYYDPTIVYGAWWWPSYPPFYWAPWPGYFVRSGFAWGAGTVVIYGFFFGDCDWHAHRVRIVNVNNYYYPRLVHDRDDATRRVPPTPGFWRHDPEHRRGVQYREARLRKEFGQAGNETPQIRKAPGVQPPPVMPEKQGGRGAGLGEKPFSPRSDSRIFPDRRERPEIREQARPEPGSAQNPGDRNGKASIPATRQVMPATPQPLPDRSAKPVERAERGHEEYRHEENAKPHEEESPATMRNRGSGTEQKREER